MCVRDDREEFVNAGALMRKREGENDSISVQSIFSGA